MLNHAKGALKNLRQNYRIRQNKLTSKTFAQYDYTCITHPSAVAPRLCGPLQVRFESLELNQGSLEAPLSVLQLSDIHLDWNTREYLWQLQPFIHQLVETQKVDAIFLTGDCIAHGSGYITELKEWCQALPHVPHRYAVLGNHDHYEESHGKEPRYAMEQGGFHVLMNETHTLQHAAGGYIHIHGLDDFVKGSPNPTPLIEHAKTHADDNHLLLLHNPAHMNEPLLWQVFDAAFAGHTHGGQIYCPEWMASIISESPYVRDWYEVDGRCQLFVHTGTGTASIPFPFKLPPLITRRFPVTLPRWGMTSEMVVHNISASPKEDNPCTNSCPP
jgi:uncharacterized protein